MGARDDARGEPRASGASALSVAVGALLLLPALYVLSLGPVAKAIDVMGLDKEPAKTFYRPVIWLHDHTPLETPLEWYLKLWGVK